MDALSIATCSFILWCGLFAVTESVDLLGAGASFPNAVYTQWINSYRRYRIKHVDVNMQYESIGSGGGKARIKGERQPEIHYAGSDITLNEDERRDYPYLTMFPTLAGAVVIAYNIPGIEHLKLNMEAIVGIYNGTIRKWNAPVIANLNPESELPSKEIEVTVRADKSGTTSAFTSGLSSYSAEWKTTYGTFSEGRDKSTRNSVNWNNSIARLFGQTNRGMSGLIMSVDYSVGYLAIATAQTSELHYAALINEAGNLVNATVETVQNAIISANGSFNIMNTAGQFAYPLASFTYFIVPMSTMSDCDSAVEFVRYVNWFYFNELAQEQAVHLYMTPLDKESASDIVNNVLKSMTCRGNNVWQLMLSQIETENKAKENEYWQIPTFICLSIIIAVSTGVSVHFGRQHIILHRELLKETWKLDNSRISLDKENVMVEKVNGRQSVNSSLRDDVLLSDSIIFDGTCWADKRGIIGVFEGQLVTMIAMRRQRNDFTFSEKKILIWLRDNIKHANIMKFIGVTKRNCGWSMVHSGIFHGSLSDILRNKRIEIHTEGLVALSMSLLKGLLYLHRKGIVHGQLTGMNCFIDSNWELRIAAWIETELVSSSKVDRNKVAVVQNGSNEDSSELLWVAPEIIKFKRMPTVASDIYSLSMVFQEIFTKQKPYHELEMTNREIINAVLTCGIRPQFCTKTPAVFRSVMERCWEIDPAARPKVEIIYNTIKSVFKVEMSFLDCIIRSVEMYAKELEGKIKDQDTELTDLNGRMNSYLYQNVPIAIANALKTKSKVDTETKENVCILVCKVANITAVIKRVTANGIVNLLNNFYTGMNQLMLQNDIYLLNRYAAETTFILGLQRKYTNTFETLVATEAASVTMKLNDYARKFNKERLSGINTEIRLQTGIGSGTVIVGIMGSLALQYTALGDVLEETAELARNAEPYEVRVSTRVYSCLKQAQFIGIHEFVKNGIVCYSLHHQNQI